MTKAEMRELIEALADEVKGYVDERMAAMPAPVVGKDGAPGLGIKGAINWEHGEHFTLELTDGTRMDIPLPKAKDGKDGASVDLAAVEAMVVKAVAALPPATPGRDGKDADPDRVREMVEVAVSALPRPRDGQDGVHGKSVTLDEVRPVFDAAFASWALDFERRAADVHRAVLEKLPVPKDGIDGMGFDDLSVEYVDGVVAFKLTRGERVKEFSFAIPHFVDRGVHKDGEVYKAGNGVTSGGSYWIAQEDNPPGRPGDEGSGWRLAVRKGRDGKDGAAPKASGPVRLG